MSVESQQSATASRMQTRVDQAHHGRTAAAVPVGTSVAVASEPDPSVLAAVAGHDPIYLREQLERHAQDLGSRLQSQQYELDRREAEFNARVAQLESEIRTARLVQIEREVELTEREQKFQRQWDELQQRAADVSAAELTLRTERTEERLVQRASMEQVQQSVQRWQRRLQALDESERQLQAQLADIAAQRVRVDKERAALQQAQVDHVAQLKQEREAARGALAQRMAKLQERSDQLERRHQAVVQLHADVLRMYREATELRLCTEELWGQMSQSESPAVLTHRLSQLRAKLHAQFQLATQALEDQKKELESLVARLASYRGEIQQRREAMQAWLQSQQEEIEGQAARLVAREQELDRQQAEIQHLRGHWEQRRHVYEQEIRRLKRRLEMAEAVA